MDAAGAGMRGAGHGARVDTKVSTGTIVQSPATDGSAVITSQRFAEELRAALRPLRDQAAHHAHRLAAR
jgi:hypothetical protein